MKLNGKGLSYPHISVLSYYLTTFQAMSKSSNKKRLKQLRNWFDNEINFKKSKRNVQNKNGRKQARNARAV